MSTLPDHPSQHEDHSAPEAAAAAPPGVAENPYPVFRARRDGTLVYANAAAEKLTRKWKWAVGQVCPEKFLQKALRAAYNADQSQEIEINLQNSTYMLMLTPVPGEALIDVYGYDLTRRKKAEAALQREKARLESWFHILQYKTLNLQIFLDYALEEAIKLTQSKIGYIYLYDDLKKEFVLNSWSRRVMEACSITEPQTTYKLEKTGFWGEVVRQAHPIILNDFHTPHPLRKGYPEGHSRLDKFMSIPVYQDTTIVAVVGVANKEDDYNETDIQQLQWLMKAVWKIVADKKAEEALTVEIQALRQRNETLEHLRALAERQIQRLTSLHTIEAAVGRAGDYNSQTALEILLKQVTQQLQVHAAAILSCSPHAQTFEYRASEGFWLPPPQHIQHFISEGGARRAALERRPVIVPNLAEAPEARPEQIRLAREDFVTYICVPLILRGQIYGLMELYHRERFELDAEALNYVEKLAGQAAAAMNGAAVFEQLQRANLELIQACDSSLEGWAHAVEVHQHTAAGQTKRIANLTIQIGEALGIGKEELLQMYRGALLHEVGSLELPEAGLGQPGPLTPEEEERLRQHPQAAYERLAPIPFLKGSLEIPYCHHENWDGSGYPRGLKGPAIPLAARIFAIAAAWETLTSKHADRKTFSHEEALAWIEAQAGKQFDPELVKVFQKLAANYPYSEAFGPAQPFLL